MRRSLVDYYRAISEILFWPRLSYSLKASKWTHVFTRRGMTPHAGDPFFLPRILPFHVLNEIALLGDTAINKPNAP
jgi:hypothetical protein